MSLTMGSGPFAGSTHAPLNFDLEGVAPKHQLFLDPVPKRIRGYLGDECVVDTRGARLLHETGLLPQWYFPREDVRMDLLTKTDHTTHCPFKGDAAYWTVTVGDRVEENAVWGYPEPLEGAPPLADLVAFYFDRLDTWLEEDEPVIGHPRDPYHRVDTRRASDHVVVTVGGETVAESRRPVKVFETGLPVRYYLPPEDVRAVALTESDTRTLCPYKGHASYWHVSGGGKTVEDGAWAYEGPYGEVLAVTGYRSFLGDGVEVTVDGEPLAS